MNSPICFSDKSPSSGRHNMKEYNTNTSILYSTLKISNQLFWHVYIYIYIYCVCVCARARAWGENRVWYGIFVNEIHWCATVYILCGYMHIDSKGENIVKWIKGQRISWLGHLERMEEDRMPKKIFTQVLERARRRGRPRKRLKEEVERDLQVLEERRWRELVADRKKWKNIVRQAKVYSGL